MRHLSRAKGENQSDQVPTKRRGSTFLKNDLAGVAGKAFAIEVPLQGIKWRSSRSSQQWWTRMSMVVFSTTWGNQRKSCHSRHQWTGCLPLSESCKKPVEGECAQEAGKQGGANVKREGGLLGALFRSTSSVREYFVLRKRERRKLKRYLFPLGGRIINNFIFFPVFLLYYITFLYLFHKKSFYLR